MGGWVNVVAIGNGIYLEDNEAFTLETPELQLFDLIVTAEEVQDGGVVVSRYASTQNVANFPLECRHGMVVKVANSFSEEDDYYVQFQGNQGVDGPGVWEEQ